MYNKLFDVLYSSEISESVKVLIAENYPPQLNEGISEDSCYVEFLKTMIDSNISEASLYDIIDEVFGDFSEEQIETVTEEFIHSLVNQYLNEGLFDTRPIGLNGLRKEAQKREAQATRRDAKIQPIGMATLNRQQNAKEKLNNQPKGSSFGDKVKKAGSAALGKLKSAVGKVRDWTKKMASNDKPVGLSKLKADQAARINRAVSAGTYKKDEGTSGVTSGTQGPSNSPNGSSRSERIRRALEKAKGTKLPDDGEVIHMDTVGARKKAAALERSKGTKLPNDGEVIHMGNKSINRREEAKKKAKGIKLPSDEKAIPLSNEKIDRRERVKEKSKGIELPSSGKTIHLDNGGSRKRAEASKRARGTILPPGDEVITLPKTYSFSELKTPKKENKTSKKGSGQLALPLGAPKKKRGRPKKKVEANEAWDEVISLLKASTISEKLLKEISEMKSSASLAKKALDRDRNDFNKAMEPLERVVASKVPISSEKQKRVIANAGDKAAHFEKMKSLAAKKYGIKF